MSYSGFPTCRHTLTVQKPKWRATMARGRALPSRAWRAHCRAVPCSLCDSCLSAGLWLCCCDPVQLRTRGTCHRQALCEGSETCAREILRLLVSSVTKCQTEWRPFLFQRSFPPQNLLKRTAGSREGLPFCVPGCVPRPELNPDAKPLTKKPGHYEAISRSDEKASIENVKSLPLRTPTNAG